MYDAVCLGAATMACTHVWYAGAPPPALPAAIDLLLGETGLFYE